MKRSNLRALVPAYHPVARAITRATAARKRLVQLALNEAEALAWETGVPHLVFLSLAEEKLEALNKWLDRQDRVRVQTAQWSLAE